MTSYTVKVESFCTGGEHVTLGLYKDLVIVKQMQITKSELVDSDVDIADCIGFLARKAIQLAEATTKVQRKVAIEGMVITL